MDANIPAAFQLTEQDIRLLILEDWENGEVTQSVPGSDIELWKKAAKDLAHDLEIHIDSPLVDDGLVYIRANHGFPIEMHWQSPEARQWLHAIPDRISRRNMWSDMFLERGGLA